MPRDVRKRVDRCQKYHRNAVLHLAWPLEQQECLRSLSFKEADLRRNDIAPPAHGTCGWLLENESFSTWLGQPQGLLWIRGNPGAGKSTLLKYAIENSLGSRAMASFFFDGRGAPIQKSPIGLYRSLLHQLLSGIPPLLSEFHSFSRENRERGAKIGKDWIWQERELRDFLESALPHVSKEYPIRIFVDALDECGEEAAQDLLHFFQCLTSKLSPEGSALSLCLSSHHRSIALRGHYHEICVEEQNLADIKTYVREELQRKFPMSDAKWLQDDIAKKSCGVFQWVSLVIQKVTELKEKGCHFREIQEWLRAVPMGLGPLYQEILTCKPDANDSLARTSQLMQWICLAERPFSMDELRFAILFDTDTSYKSLQEYRDSATYIANNGDMERLVKRLSGGLAEVKEQGDRRVARFIHQSVKDYLAQGGLQSLESISLKNHGNKLVERLIRQSIDDYLAHGSLQALISILGEECNDNLGAHSIHQLVESYLLQGDIQDLDDLLCSSATGRGHYRLSRSCIKYFITDDIQHRNGEAHGQNHEQTFPFLQYATTSWITHAGKSEAEKVPQSDLLDYLEWPSDHLLKHWAHVYCDADFPSHGHPRGLTTLLHVASSYGIMSVIRAILSRGINGMRDKYDGDGRTALSWAAENGNEPAVRLLIENSATLESKDSRYDRTALSWAAREGHEPVVKLLIDKGAELESENYGGLTALSWAAQRGHEPVVRLLLEKGAKLNSRDRKGQSALSWAAQYGNEVVVNLLAGRGAELNSKLVGFHRTAVSLAAENGYERIVKILIEYGAEFESEDEGGRTPLMWAVWNGHLSTVKLLLEKGAVLDRRDTRRGRTALHCAVRYGHEPVAELLIAEGANIDPKDTKHSRTALGWAAQKGLEPVTKLLVEKGADLEARDRGFGQSALSLAAGYGHDSIVKLLIGKGANLESKDAENKTPLIWAARYGHEPAVKTLIEAGAELGTQGTDGLTPLSWAVRQGHDPITSLLIEKGAQACSRAVWEAAGRGNESTIKLLIENGASVNAIHEWGRTALMWAIWHKHASTARTLMSLGTDPDIEDQEGQTAFSYAASHGSYEILTHLLPQTRNLETRDRSNNTPFFLAASNGHSACAALLADHGADLNAKDTGNNTGLLCAARRGFEAVVRLLVERRAELEGSDNMFGRTPLMWAVCQGNEAIVRLLVAAGAKRDMVDRKGRSAVEAAEVLGHAKILEILRLATHRVNS
ncbi:MAG: hypothetical protein M1840_004832 [Geoglossum simile]|nr:MAG: hypothetical protein M1840_004832 [Geoglossum simile]